MKNLSLSKIESEIQDAKNAYLKNQAVFTGLIPVLEGLATLGCKEVEIRESCNWGGYALYYRGLQLMGNGLKRFNGDRPLPYDGNSSKAYSYAEIFRIQGEALKVIRGNLASDFALAKSACNKERSETDRILGAAI